jgi:tRNA U34 2-thiouridine synthase MnmA/TrmU
MLSEFHECFTYQLEPINDPLTAPNYFYGDVFQARWITDSVRQGELLKPQDYFSFSNTHEKSKRISFGSKSNVKYTIREAVKVFEIALQNKSKSKSACFWMEIERRQILPKRSADSLRNFWKTVERKGLENYMKDALEGNTWYCHAFCKIPKVQLICTVSDDAMNGEFETSLIQQVDSVAPQRTTHR